MLMTTQERGAQAQEDIPKNGADRVRNASSVWLGATLGCAECHDHKYDPYTTRDFDSFAAFFADEQETAVGQQQPIGIPSKEQAAELRKIEERIAELKKGLNGKPKAG